MLWLLEMSCDYFGHSENILLAMLTDNCQQIRELACRRILATRIDSLASTQSVREFRVLKLNFESDDYINLVSWAENDRLEPPLLRNVSDNDLKQCITNKNFDTLQFPRFPCHTQGTERCIRLVTQASAAKCGQERQDGFICVRIQSRTLMKKFETKNQFQLPRGLSEWGLRSLETFIGLYRKLRVRLRLCAKLIITLHGLMLSRSAKVHAFLNVKKKPKCYSLGALLKFISFQFFF